MNSNRFNDRGFNERSFNDRSFNDRSSNDGFNNRGFDGFHDSNNRSNHPQYLIRDTRDFDNDTFYPHDVVHKITDADITSGKYMDRSKNRLMSQISELEKIMDKEEIIQRNGKK